MQRFCVWTILTHLPAASGGSQLQPTLPGRWEGVVRMCSLLMISQGTLGTSGLQFGSNNKMSGSIYLSIHLSCALPQGLSWGDFGSPEWGVAKRREAGPWHVSSVTRRHLARVSQQL